MIKLEAEKSDGAPDLVPSLASLYDDLLEKLANELESIRENEGQQNLGSNSYKIDSSSFILACQLIVESSFDKETKGIKFREKIVNQEELK